MFTTSNGALDPRKDHSKYGVWESQESIKMNENMLTPKGRRKTVAQIRKHLDKSDIVPMDLRWLSEQAAKKVLEYVNTLSDADKAKIIIMR